MCEVKVFANSTQLCGHLAEHIARLSNSSCESSFHVALSGGSLPKLLGTAMSCEEFSSINCSHWKIAFADERVVPLDHSDSNYAACRTDIFDKIESLKSEQIIAIDDFMNADVASQKYEEQLKEAGIHNFDLVLLGMGPDGHTASLFPGHELLRYDGVRQVVPIHDSPKPPAQRITLTLSKINQAQDVIFVVTGAAKAAILAQILTPDGRSAGGYVSHSDIFPAGMISPVRSLTWYLDAEAASLLQSL